MRYLFASVGITNRGLHSLRHTAATAMVKRVMCDMTHLPVAAISLGRAVAPLRSRLATVLSRVRTQ